MGTDFGVALSGFLFLDGRQGSSWGPNLNHTGPGGHFRLRAVCGAADRRGQPLHLTGEATAPAVQRQAGSSHANKAKVSDTVSPYVW